MADGILTIRTADNWPLRLWRGGSGPLFVFLQGRADFLEKHVPFFEVVAAAGFDVLAPEWRGQGLSGRALPNRHKGHIDDFDTYLSDLASLIATETGSYHIGGFSMGGHLALRHYLERDKHRAIRSISLISPMIGVLTTPLPAWLARGLARRRKRAGRGHEYVPGRGDYRPIAESHRRRLTSDAAAYRHVERHLRENRDLALGGPTYGWLAAALRSQEVLMQALASESFGDWPPVLMQLPERDRLVSLQASRRLAARMQGCTVINYPGTQHDLLIEEAEKRQKVLADLIDFLGKSTAI